VFAEAAFLLVTRNPVWGILGLPTIPYLAANFGSSAKAASRAEKRSAFRRMRCI
jgi:hypothetical protein